MDDSTKGNRLAGLMSQHDTEKVSWPLDFVFSIFSLQGLQKNCFCLATDTKLSSAMTDNV